MLQYINILYVKRRPRSALSPPPTRLQSPLCAMTQIGGSSHWTLRPSVIQLIQYFTVIHIEALLCEPPQGGRALRVCSSVRTSVCSVPAVNPKTENRTNL